MSVEVMTPNGPVEFKDTEESHYSFHTEMGVLLITRVRMGGGLVINVPHPFKAFAPGFWVHAEIIK